MDCEGLPTELPAAQQQILAQSKQLTDQSKQLGEQSACIEDLQYQVAYLKEQLVLANIRRFGRSSERYVDPDDPQGRLFDEAMLPEQETIEEAPEPQTVAEHKHTPRSILPTQTFLLYPFNTNAFRRVLKFELLKIWRFFVLQKQ